MDLARLHSNISGLDAVDLAIEVFESLEAFIADLNRYQLYEQGQRNDGSMMEPDYTNVTKDIKSYFNQRIDHVTLKDTGDLHKSIFANISETIILDSNDWKVSELTSKYGEFLGLTPESIEKLSKKFTPIFLDKFYGRVLA